MKSVIIVGGGFGGLNAAKGLARAKDISVTLVDRQNHHLFQPLLYQVAMAGLSPADIAVPIRSLVAPYANVRVVQGNVRALDLNGRTIETDFGTLPFDYLVLACGARHSYFGHDQWEYFAPGLKTIEQATEIRRRVLMAFEEAERCDDPGQRKRLLTFVIVGGGPTGVELAGAIGEMTRFTLAKDFRKIDAKLARIMLIEGSHQILQSFSKDQAGRAVRDLESLGVQVWTNSMVTGIDERGVAIGQERIDAATVLWAAGVEASPLARATGAKTDRQGRVEVDAQLCIPGHSNVFAIGDMASTRDEQGLNLPATAPVALQQGRYVAQVIRDDLRGRPRRPFRFFDKGQMATIGRSRAVIEIGRFHLAGRLAWFLWLIVHIYYLTGFRNRVFVVIHWAWAYLTFRRGARLIVGKEWRNRPDVPTAQRNSS
jgi:NADH dehydrogenase